MKIKIYKAFHILLNKFVNQICCIVCLIVERMLKIAKRVGVVDSVMVMTERGIILR